MHEDDNYRSGSLWKHNTSGAVVRVVGSNEDTVLFVYDSNKDKGGHFATSKPLFELFYEKVDPSEEGMIYLSKVDD